MSEQERQRKAALDRQRGSAASRGYGYKWQKASKLFLDANPLCVACLGTGTVEPSTEVDHIIPHRGDPKLFWRRSNWQALCKTCHSAKTARETFHQGKPIKPRLGCNAAGQPMDPHHHWNTER